MYLLDNRQINISCFFFVFVCLFTTSVIVRTLHSSWPAWTHDSDSENVSFVCTPHPGLEKNNTLNLHSWEKKEFQDNKVLQRRGKLQGHTWNLFMDSAAYFMARVMHISWHSYLRGWGAVNNTNTCKIQGFRKVVIALKWAQRVSLVLFLSSQHIWSIFSTAETILQICGRFPYWNKQTHKHV